MPTKKPLVLLILDGWGYNENNQYNAIAQAQTPQWDSWWRTYPHILLQASGSPVGLPNGQMGNSEVGHMHLGAGRMIQQDFTRINEAIGKDEFVQNLACVNLIHELKRTKKSLHIIGLLSTGGVHSHEQHLYALLALCYYHQFNTVYLHLFLDGRDTSPKSALESLARLDMILQQYPIAVISSICGRYYAMDRDQRWERVQPVYDMLTQAVGEAHFADAQSAVNHYYQQQISDEFIPATLIGNASPIQDGDAVLFFNFRADRARQLTAAFVEPLFEGFKRRATPKLSAFISMTQYDKNLVTVPLFPPISLDNTLGEVLSAKGLNQLRIAETEKYAHVTFFFNGGKENVLTNEKRILIPSPKVSTYDQQPEMSAQELTTVLVDAIERQSFDVIICNFANADMVGHTGNLPATIKAIECLDKCMQQIGHAVKKYHGKLLITADHGNAEKLYDDNTHQAHTAHTNEPVPLLYVGDGWHFNKAEGSLVDVAPTVLRLLDIPQPPEMTGSALLECNHATV